MKKNSILPRGKYVLIKPEDEKSKTTDSGLIIPDNVEKEQKKASGIVLDVGSDIKDIKKGDKILYGMYAGETVMLMENGKEVEYRLLFDDDVIGYLYE